MPTENRRVAAYLPKSIDDRLEAFKAERGLKGDSPALIVILSEFLGVSQEVAYQGSSSTQLDERIELLKSELLDELKSRLLGFQAAIEQRLQKLEEKADLLSPANAQFELLSEPEEDSLAEQEVPGQLKLIPIDEIGDSHFQVDELLSESKSELQNDVSESVELQPLSEPALAKRLGVTVNRLRQVKSQDKKVAGSLARWSRAKDNDGIAWEYDSRTRLFHPAF